MNPVKIPDGLSIQGGEKHTIKGGKGVHDIEAIVTQTKKAITVSTLIECDEVDMLSLHRDQRFWLHFHGAPILPFSLDTAFVSGAADPDDELTKQLQGIGKLLAAAWTVHANGPDETKQQHLDKLLGSIAELATTARLGSSLHVPGMRV